MEASKWANPPLVPSQPARSSSPPLPQPTNQQEPLTQNYDPADMDEFAQTRPTDDLFADDFTPMAEPLIQNQPHSPDPPLAPGAPRAPRGRGSQRAGRGRGSSRPIRPTPANDSTADVQQIPKAPEGPRKEAVRGDRSGTGGVKKAKLTEEELTARMEAIKEKNASLEAAHARAEADEASFKQREAEARQKSKLERQNRQQLMGEREKNRMRKLNAQQGREWDAEKTEEDIRGANSGRAQAFRGAHGGISQTSRPTEDEPNVAREETEGYDTRGAQRSRGRGRGSRGRARGGPEARPQQPKEQQVPTDVDFPALAVASTVQTSAKDAEGTASVDEGIANLALTSASDNAVAVKPIDTTATSASWAEEMETPIDTRK